MISINKKKANKILYIIGTAALISMLAFLTVNFIRDARLLELPLLSKVAGTSAADKKDDNASDYKTLKFKKADTKSKAETTKSKASPEPTVKTTAAPTATPVPTNEP